MNDISGLGSITLRQIRAFVSVGDTRSFTAAATVLNLTQAAVSVLIRDLEAELGLRLFDRTTRSVRLTEAGQDLLPSARRIMGDLHASITNSRETATKRRGRVRVAATPLFSSLFLPEIILRYRQRFPGVDIVVCDRPAGTIAGLVENGEVDLGVGTMPGSNQKLAWDPLLDDDVVLVCPPDHPLARRTSITWRDLTRSNYIAISPENGTRQIVDACTAAAGVSLRPTYEVASVWTLLGMVSAGLGVGLATGQVRKLSRLYNVSIRQIERKRIERPVVLMRHSHRSLSPASESFRALIREVLKDTLKPESIPRARVEKIKSRT